VMRWRKETPSAFEKMVKGALKDIKDKEFISQSDFELLIRLTEPIADHQVARDVYQRMFDSKETSTLALSLASVALNSHLDALSASKGDAVRARGVGTADVGGAIGGAAVGSRWGWLGALIGGIVGGAAMSIAKALEDEDKD